MGLYFRGLGFLRQGSGGSLGRHRGERQRDKLLRALWEFRDSKGFTGPYTMVFTGHTGVTGFMGVFRVRGSGSLMAPKDQTPKLGSSCLPLLVRDGV